MYNNKRFPICKPCFQNTNVLSWIFENFVLLMVCYFVLSIINSLAQSYHKRINKKLAKTESGKID
jgi:hypothetical protein